MSQLLYNLRLVGKSLRRDPWFTVVMVVSQALSVSLLVTALTTVRRYSDMTGQVQPDVFRVERSHGEVLRTIFRRTQFEWFGGFSGVFLDLPATAALTEAGAPAASSRLFVSALVGGPEGALPRRLPVRFCEAALFTLFNVDFKYGGPWNGADERDPARAHVAVLTELQNQQLYGGADSVGRRLRVAGRDLTIVGVLRQRLGKLQLWDFGTSPENITNILVPLALAPELRPVPVIGWPTTIGQDAWAANAQSPAAFVEYWVRLPGPEARRRFAAAMAAQDPTMRLVAAEEIVRAHAHAPPPYRLFLIFTLVLLEASVINVMRMLLAKASARAAEIGIHRALGAGRAVIFGRQLCEGVAVSLAGSVFGVALAIPTVAAFDRLIPDSPIKLALTPSVVATTFLLCLLAGLVSGIYPAWRVASEPPTRYLGKI